MPANVLEFTFVSGGEAAKGCAHPAGLQRATEENPQTKTPAAVRKR